MIKKAVLSSLIVMFVLIISNDVFALTSLNLFTKLAKKHKTQKITATRPEIATDDKFKVIMDGDIKTAVEAQCGAIPTKTVDDLLTYLNSCDAFTAATYLCIIDESFKKDEAVVIATTTDCATIEITKAYYDSEKTCRTANGKEFKELKCGATSDEWNRIMTSACWPGHPNQPLAVLKMPVPKITYDWNNCPCK